MIRIKNAWLYLVIAVVPALAACNTSADDKPTDASLNPETTVEVTSIAHGAVEDKLLLAGTTVYLKRNTVVAPIPAFITGVHVKLGDRVNRGDVLFELESKERRALGNSAGKLDPGLANFGRLQVKATASGIISTLDKQQPGDYVLEGAPLCTIAASSDLAFQVNVPFEYIAFTAPGKKCTIILPDSTVLRATFTTPLTTMNPVSQTQTILARSQESLFLPENMIIRVLVGRNDNENRQLLPKESVLSDELMKRFWVMKLINDSTAIKVPVTIGNKNNEVVEVLAPEFSPDDRIISTGNFGLPDTASVQVR